MTVMEHIRLQPSMLFRAYVHTKIARRQFVWLAVIAVLTFPFTLPFPWSQEEFGQFALLYGVFLAPLIAAWITPRLLLDDACLTLWRTIRLPLWRLALEKSLLLWLFHILLWTVFLGISWLSFALRTANSSQILPLTLSSVGRIWLGGTASIFLFSVLGLVLSRPGQAARGGWLATGLWLGGIILGRTGGNSVFTPFHVFFALQDPHLGLQQGLLMLMGLLAFGIGIWRIWREPTTSPGRVRLPSRPLAAWPASLLTRGPAIARLAWMEWLIAVRRQTLWVYMGVPLALVLAALFTSYNPSLTVVAPLVLGSVDIAPQPDEGGREVQKTQVSAGQFVTPGTYAAPMLDLADEALDPVAGAVHTGIVRPWLLAVDTGRDHGLHTPCCHIREEALCIIAAVGDDVRTPIAGEQGFGLGDVMRRSRCPRAPQGVAPSVHAHVHLRAAPAATPAQGLGGWPPFWAGAPPAHGCARTTVLSMTRQSRSGSVRKYRCIRSQIPRSHPRAKRW